MQLNTQILKNNTFYSLKAFKTLEIKNYPWSGIWE